MNKLCIHYPNKSDKETYHICAEVWFNFIFQFLLIPFQNLDHRKLESM
jgi:hypothetical protein